MSAFNKRQKVNGLIQPVAHQGSVIVNCLAMATLIPGRKRIRQALDDQRVPENDPRRRMMLTASSTPKALFACVMHELAFRDRPGFTSERRGSVLQQSDCEVWTTFNDRVFDMGNDPQFVGLIDNGQKPDIAETLRSTQLAVAAAGTRSTWNTSRFTIHAGDMVYWDYPRVRGRTNKADRPELKGIPDDKLMAITRGMPQDFMASLNLFSLLFPRNNRTQAQLAQQLEADNVPDFIRPIFTVALVAAEQIQRNPAQFVPEQFAQNGALALPPEIQIYFPKTTLALQQGQDPQGRRNRSAARAMLIVEALERIHSMLECHKVGLAMSMSIEGSQLDVYVRA